MNKTTKTILRIVLPLAFGAIILWLLYRNMDFAAVYETLRSDANYWIIFASCLFGTAGNTFRGLRWQLLNKALPNSQGVKMVNSILTTHGNYAVNMALPRLGEVWRCAAMGHYSSVGFSSLFGTLIVDRASDFVVVGVLLLISVLLNAGFFRDFFQGTTAGGGTLYQITASPKFYIGLMLIIVLIVVSIWVLRKSRLGEKLQQQVRLIRDGLRTVATLEQQGLFYLYTLLIWLGYFLQFYLTFYAFSFTTQLGVGVGLLTFLMSSIAIAAPVQAGMGAWHFMVIYTLGIFGVQQTDAASFALIVHTLQTLWMTLVGLVAIALLPLFNNGERVRPTAREEIKGNV
ncbi:MAG: lysylphosphatidylglycerol synthase transmembrane domain-containing protein [Porphyromonas sp.]|nr:lysylphosphatidylglycerol synthase transmembrane domain-containing protein [Porphyromonas sp.]